MVKAKNVASTKNARTLLIDQRSTVEAVTLNSRSAAHSA
jgi:hypothetical protein